MTDDESEIRRAWDAGDMRLATSAAVRKYGAEIYGFLVALTRGDAIADDAFSLFMERLWKTLPSFEWKCPVRAWAYMLARHACVDARRMDARHQRARASSAELDELAARIRTETQSALRSANRTELQRLRDELAEEDRMLLILRVDRRLAWLDVVRVLGADGVADDPEQRDRESARLRQRFSLVRRRLRTRVRELGLT